MPVQLYGSRHARPLVARLERQQQHTAQGSVRHSSEPEAHEPEEEIEGHFDALEEILRPKRRSHPPPWPTRWRACGNTSIRCTAKRSTPAPVRARQRRMI